MAGLKLDFSAIRELGKAIAGTTETRQQTKKAVVREITDGGAVVEIAGSGVLTPVESSTATYSVGDVVTVTNRGGKLHIDGDVSAPSVGAGYVRKTVQPVVQAVAEAAQTAANGVKAGADAQKVADEAKAAAAATNQHFWTDTNGVHVTEQTQEDWQTAQTGSNILINSLGLLLRKALHNLVSVTASAAAFYDGSGNEAENITARFGSDGAQIGKADGVHSEMSADGYSVYNSDAYETFNVSSEGVTTSVTVTDRTESGVRTTLSNTTVPSRRVLTLSNEPVSGTVMQIDCTCAILGNDGIGHVYVKFAFPFSSGTVRSHTVSSGINVNAVVTQQADGSYTLAMSYTSQLDLSSVYVYDLAITYNVTTVRPKLTFGLDNNNSGAFGVALGHGLKLAYDNQAVFGTYNDNSADNLLELGNGTYDNKSNAFAVSRSGNVTADGNITAAGKVNNHSARKTLWTGEFSSGSLVVNGLDQYSLVEVTFKSIATHATCWLSGSRSRAYLRGSNTYVSASRIIDYIVGLDATINDGYVTLSWVNCKERNMLISSQATTISDIIITSIIGVL